MWRQGGGRRRHGGGATVLDLGVGSLLVYDVRNAYLILHMNVVTIARAETEGKQPCHAVAAQAESNYHN